jgi:hypothetical protein
VAVYFADVEVGFSRTHPKYGKLKGAFVWCFTSAPTSKAARKQIGDALVADGLIAKSVELVEEYDPHDPPDWGSPESQLEYDAYAAAAQNENRTVYAPFHGYVNEEE